jgi:hypothetical protein
MIITPHKKPDFNNLNNTLLNKNTYSVPLIELAIDPGIKSIILQ